ncbi:MAG: carboxypeptidase-like regulatory domain-containing protein [Planctomycetaceae bacterium]
MLIARIALGLSCLGMLLPQAAMSATPRLVQNSAMSDVVLGVRGTLVGRVVDGRGRAMSGRTVRVHRGTKLIAWVQTDRTGRFTVQNLPGGPYAVTSGSATQLVRAWAAGSAPPRTAAAIVLVDQPLVVRGQDGEVAAESDGLLGGMSEFGLVAVGATVITIPILIAENDDDDAPPASP